MRPEERHTREQRATDGVFVIARTPDGFRVHAPQNGRTTYTVGSDLSSPTCTCPDFAYHRSDPDWRCKHILAVDQRFAAPAPPENLPAVSDEDEERAAIQDEGKPPRKVRTPRASNGTTQMLLKRSVSPDGRIDSLSVEFSCPVDKTADGEIETQAAALIGLQNGIIRRFLSGNGSTPARPALAHVPAPAPTPAPVPVPTPVGTPAKLVRIDGMDGKYGRRLYLVVQANGSMLRLYGSAKQLGDALAAAGFPDHAPYVAEGTTLDLPCRIVTKPSPDGRYQNIERVLPAEPPPRRNGS